MRSPIPAAFLCLVLAAACGNNEGPVIDGAPGSADAPPGTADAAVTADAAPPDAFIGPADGVACGVNLCAVGEICCIRAGQAPVCQNPAQQCMGGEIHCDGPEDCDPGQICCGDPMNSSCTTAASCTSGEMCHTVDTCTTGDNCCQYGGGPAMDPYHQCTTGPCPL